jgi:hypothetical protein
MISQIKLKVSDKEGIPPVDFALEAVEGVPLHDDSTVSGAGFDGSTTHALTLVPFMCDCTVPPTTLSTRWGASRVARLLCAGSPAAACAQLASALRLPAPAAARGGRFPVGAPPAGAVLVELLLGVVEFARDQALPPPAAAAALSAVHGLVAGAAAAARGGGGGGWPPLAAARASWEAALSAATAPARGATGPGQVLSHAQGAALNAFVQDSSLLLAHHWDMYREALGGGGGGGGEGPGTRVEAVVALVEEPPAPEALPPLAAAREAGEAKEVE